MPTKLRMGWELEYYPQNLQVLVAVPSASKVNWDSYLIQDHLGPLLTLTVDTYRCSSVSPDMGFPTFPSTTIRDGPYSPTVWPSSQQLQHTVLWFTRHSVLAPELEGLKVVLSRSQLMRTFNIWVCTFTDRSETSANKLQEWHLSGSSPSNTLLPCFHSVFTLSSTSQLTPARTSYPLFNPNKELQHRVLRQPPRPPKSQTHWPTPLADL